jgi:hypothetical protein
MSWCELGFGFRTRGYEDNDDDYCHHIETGPQGIEDSDPLSRHTGNTTLDDHEEGGKEEQLVVLWCVIGNGYRSSSKNHRRH